MEYDSASGCDERLRDLEFTGVLPRGQRSIVLQTLKNSDTTAPWQPVEVLPVQPKVTFNINKLLSKQVMEYYKKYSQNSNLDQYFSLPETETSASETHRVKYYYSIYELNPIPSTSRHDCVGQEYNNFGTGVPRERRRWARPTFIGQSCTTNNSAIFQHPLTEPRSPTPEPKTIPEQRNQSRASIPEILERKSKTSPTSSVASYKLLEWDSGADVGYFNTLPINNQNCNNLSTTERMTMASGCSAALRQDPEGTTESNLSNNVPQAQCKRKPNANSTPLPGTISETESEVEITPIVKNHMPGVITSDDIKSEEKKGHNKESADHIHFANDSQTPIALHVFKVPALKCGTEVERRIKNSEASSSFLKKSSSMNLLAAVTSKFLVKRSQSDLNIETSCRSSATLPLIFDSTSSLATVVNKPVTCDKVIQTTINEHFQESIGIQVSVLEEEPPVPKDDTSLAQKLVPSILKNPIYTYKVQQPRKPNGNIAALRQDDVTSSRCSSIDASQDGPKCLMPHPNDTLNATGRANSFEYFPGHIYENVTNDSESRVSSIDTRRSNSTMPNTSSSIDEKLWGHSNSLLTDLERSVNILKSLVDANKCDQQVKRRLIHHVVKRLVTARYTDDKIEHNLEENVPWNPDDARKKVYRVDIIQGLTKKENTTDSSGEWKSLKKKNAKKQLDEEVSIADERITLESSNSEKFDHYTDRVAMDGRKARMGLRTDDCQRSSSSPTDANKSESSECFLPQRRNQIKALDSIFRFKQISDIAHRDESTSDTPLIQERIYLDTMVDNDQSTIASSSGAKDNVDWRFPATLSERQFELRRCRTSESGDSKLLEQPKKLDRTIRMSPKKIKHTTVKPKPLGLRKFICTTRTPDIPKVVQRRSSDMCDDSNNPQWPAHCNLTNCQSIVNVNTNNICKSHKRNSCTQTKTESSGAQSQAGNEIKSIPARLDNLGTKLPNIHVQTSSFPLSVPQVLDSRIIPSREISQSQVHCSIHKNILTTEHCICSGPICSCGIQSLSKIAESPEKTTCLCHLANQILSYKNFANACGHGSPSPHSQRQSVLTPHAEQFTGENRTNAGTYAFGNSLEKDSCQSEPKEAKNIVNATKSKCTCNNCLCEICQVKCKTTTSEICKVCIKKIATDLSHLCSQCQNNELGICLKICTCKQLKGEFQKLCSCPDTCMCEYKQVDAVSLTNETACNACYKKLGCKKCKCPNDCNCENKKLNKVQGEKKPCNGYGNRECGSHDYSRCLNNERQVPQPNPHDLPSSALEEQLLLQPSGSRNDGLCKCGKVCCCENKLTIIEQRLNNPKYSIRRNCFCISTTADNTGSNHQHCQICGSMYRNERKCKCRINYPKPIAYELSFAVDKRQKNSDKRIKKNVNVDLGISIFPELPVCNSLTNSAKSGGCLCEKTRSHSSSQNSGQHKTLQDYLAQNKPDFVNNVATRQQCLFEISHLRELRKEKRVQLLALASFSNLTKIPRASSKAKELFIQRQISNKEMKDRLRKRYYKLHEVSKKRQQQEIQEQARRNKLMADIFCKKLQQRVLKGQVDLSNSVSVITSL